jgi:hypothetical protein
MAGNQGHSHRPEVLQDARVRRSMFGCRFQPPIGSGGSASGSPARRSSTARPSTGCRQAGQISASGRRTKRRRWARGCGRIGGGASRRRSSMAIRSRSRVRGAFGKGRVRPAASSILWSIFRRHAGSLTPPTASRRAIPLTKGGAPGADSSGTVRYQRDSFASLHPGSRPRAVAASRQVSSGVRPSAATRLDPIATRAVFFRPRIIRTSS